MGKWNSRRAGMGWKRKAGATIGKCLMKVIVSNAAYILWHDVNIVGPFHTALPTQSILSNRAVTML